ncbi:PAS domain S-box protein [Methylococcaceae bacterium WWC4]|nr:PAS domain S-box protein [Methylococcaceae bacterium WWC4]
MKPTEIQRDWPALADRRADRLAWPGPVLFALALFSMAFGWIQTEQQNLLDRVGSQQAWLRNARVDLAKGYLHVFLSATPESPFDRREGLALLDQASRALAAALAEAPASPAGKPAAADPAAQKLTAYTETMRQFRETLAGVGDGIAGNPRLQTELRIRFFELERQAQALDNLIAANLGERMRTFGRYYGWLLGTMACALLGIGWVAYRAKRGRDRVEAGLRLWARAFDQADFGLAIADATDDSFLAVNPKFAAERGYAPEDLIGQPIAKVYPPEVWPQIQRLLPQLDRNGHGMFETEHIDRNGRRFPVMIDITVTKDADGKPLRRVAYALNISERKAAERALRLSEARFQDIAKASADWIWEVDADWRFRYVSDSIQDQLDYRADEMLGASFFDLLAGDAAGPRETLAEIAEHGLPFRDLEYTIRNRQDQHRQVLANGVPIRGDDGSVLGYRGLTRDITEKRQAERHLLVNQERLQLALLASEDGLWDWDIVEGGAYVTHRYREMTGYRPDSTMPYFDFFLQGVLAEDRERVQAAFNAHFAGETQDVDIDYRLANSAGPTQWLRVKGRVVERTIDGKPLRMVGVMSDVSTQKDAEALLLRQTGELARRNAELERFNRAMVGRELEMIRLKQEINELSARLGEAPPYRTDFIHRGGAVGGASGDA